MAFGCRVSDCNRHQFFSLKDLNSLPVRLLVLVLVMCLFVLVVDAQYANKMQTLKGEVNRVSARNSSGNNSTILNRKGANKITLIEKLIKANNRTNDNMLATNKLGDAKTSPDAVSLLPNSDSAGPRLIRLPRQYDAHSIPISTPRAHLQSSDGIASNEMAKGERRGLTENVVLSSKDAEREAQLLYEKSLKEFHDSIKAEQSSTSNSSAKSVFLDAERSLFTVCDVWTQKHCQCIGVLGRLSITCRNIGILAVPVHLPPDTVTL